MRISSVSLLEFEPWKHLKRSLLAVVLLSATSSLADSGITYHGRLLKSDLTPVDGTAVEFKIQIRTPGPENCLMYEETHLKNLSLSNGFFAVGINDLTALHPNIEPFGLDRVFQNRGTFHFGVGKCGTGNSWQPNPTDGRKIVVEFNDGTFAGWEPLPTQAIHFVPMAIESITVGGYRAENLLRIVDGSGNPLPNVNPLTSTQHNSLIDLVNGTSGVYRTAAAAVPGADVSGNISGNAGGFTGNLAGDVTGAQGATSVVRIQGRNVDTAPPSNGQVLKWNSGASRWEPAADLNSGGGGGISVVTGSGAISVVDGTTAPVISVRAGDQTQTGVLRLAASGDNTFPDRAVSAADSRLSDARTPTAHNHTYANIDSAAAAYLTYKPNNVACANDQVLKWNHAQQRWDCGNDAVGAGGGIGSLGSQTGSSQTFGAGTFGTTPSIISAADVHVLNIPMASTALVTSGNISYVDYMNFTGKVGPTRTITAGTGLTGGGDLSADRTLNVDVGTGNNQIVQLNGTAQLPPVSGVNLTNLNATNITSGTLDVARLPTTVTDGLWVASAGNVTRATGNVGIGTATATQKLHVVGTSGNTLKIVDGNQGNNKVLTSDANGVASWQTPATGGDFMKDGSVPMTGGIVLPTGSWAAPSLSFSGDPLTGFRQLSSGVIAFMNNGSGVWQMKADTFDGAGPGGPTLRTGTLNSAIQPTYSFYGNNNTGFFQPATNMVGVTVNGAEAMRIDNSGNVGIGTTTAATKLHINGTLKVADGAETCNTGTHGGMIRYSGTSLQYCNGTAWQTVGTGAGGMVSLGGLSGPAQTFASGSAGNAPSITSATTIHTLNVPLASASGSVTSGTISNADYVSFAAKVAPARTITAGTGLTGGGDLSTDRTLAVNVGTGASQIPQLDAGGKLLAAVLPSSVVTTSTSLVGDVTGSLGATKVEKIQGSDVATTAPGAGQVMMYVGSKWTPSNFGMSHLKTSGGLSQMPGSACAAHQTLAWSSLTDLFTCANVVVGTAGLASDSVTSAKILDGTIATADLATGIQDGLWTGGSGNVYRTSGRVGVGTATPRATLDVFSGSIVGKPATVNAGTTIDFSAGNIQYTTLVCQAFSLQNLKDGGSYMFIVQNTTSALCSFTAFSDAGVTALTVHMPPDHGSSTAGKHTVYNIAVAGGRIYVAWTPGY